MHSIPCTSCFVPVFLTTYYRLEVVTHMCISTVWYTSLCWGVTLIPGQHTWTPLKTPFYTISKDTLLHYFLHRKNRKTMSHYDKSASKKICWQWSNMTKFVALIKRWLIKKKLGYLDLECCKMVSLPVSVVCMCPGERFISSWVEKENSDSICSFLNKSSNWKWR